MFIVIFLLHCRYYTNAERLSEYQIYKFMLSLVAYILRSSNSYKKDSDQLAKYSIFSSAQILTPQSHLSWYVPSYKM